MIGKRAVAAMECSIEASDLRQFRPAQENDADRREIVRLMQRRQRDVTRKAREHGFVYPDRLAEFRAAMHHPMPHRDKIDALRLPEPGCRDFDRR